MHHIDLLLLIIRDVEDKRMCVSRKRESLSLSARIFYSSECSRNANVMRKSRRSGVTQSVALRQLIADTTTSRQLIVSHAASKHVLAVATRSLKRALTHACCAVLTRATRLRLSAFKGPQRASSIATVAVFNLRTVNCIRLVGLPMIFVKFLLKLVSFSYNYNNLSELVAWIET